MRSAHLASQKNDQNLSKAVQLKENIINVILPQMNTIRCRIVAFLRLNKSIQNNKRKAERSISKDDVKGGGNNNSSSE